MTPPAVETNPDADRIQALFNRIAPVYDRLNDWLSVGQHRIWKLMTVKWSQASSGDTCLDLCCGSGDLAQLLGERVGKTGQVFGVDFSCAQLEIARQRCDREASRNENRLYPPQTIHWIEADALHLPFADNFFDAATMGYGLRNVTDIPRSLQELHRVLKPGATAAILDFHRPSNPTLHAVQQWILQTIVVPVATANGLQDEYAYILPSLEKFPQGPEQIRLAQQAGFAQATHYPISGGIMGVLVVTKPQS
ncbi:bifunctional demethylmenaquinone methyltransferase/2-methoxy-6-polyprenyl-1,4-benzoquinol methylase UbiE [Laspinema olomoucense]|uniref:bifunctional demethylmenaquinone methyltransferase/2-methoxy-6-polyprenyl-1,4-benzoquinol methylase UbiE n=1 Tax=Laspinema olomoucense TaxID=3231600 RepID=UPI0021BB4A31|nr:bifunctional demethylmenaquinone methyltransferase/2-methoxy-6-polyprenyl-1,4-benzoquinol methylase UbiE [Laspinema sp. D3c]MCT7993966.1 bifunctional demethylmenaquinone methyltransferase/2-methoxy-6-polyprenyl-1,4-benzoquinol methylase UbiE [Laspinema sp. D3c]